MPRQRAEHEESQFRRRDRVAAGRVHHDRAVLRGGLDVHIVHADPGAADHAQRLRRLDDFLGHLRFRTDDQRRGVGHERQQFRLRQFFGQDDDVKFGARLQQRDAFGRDGIADDDFHVQKGQRV